MVCSQFFKKVYITFCIFLFLCILGKEKLLQFEIETRSVVKASDFLNHLILFKNIVDSGYKPNLVIIEVSPETTNLNSPFHAKTQYTTNILKYQFLLELSQIAEKSWFKTVLT